MNELNRVKYGVKYYDKYAYTYGFTGVNSMHPT